MSRNSSKWARAFEIDAMHTAMKTASSTSTHRAWQTLPRHLRRRAASHDVRRVPLRLREKARAEMDPVRKKSLRRAMSKRGKSKHLSRTESLLKRQRDKMWLETHIWHAKRMHMEKIWGYTLATTPTDKAYRPSHRASIQDSILHDASYYSLAEIKGPEMLLIAMLEMSCDPQGPGPGSKRCLGGSRTLETHLYKPDSYPFDLIGPITIIWQPKSTSSNVKSSTSRSRKNNEKEPQAVLPTSGQAGSMTARTIWLRFHPSVQLEVFDTLKQTASRTLEKYKTNSNGPQEVTLEIADLKRHVNVFEIMGPKSSQVIKGALSPVAPEKREEFLKFWASLTNLQTAGSIPRGMIIGFKVNDPRLKFPPKNAKPKIDNSSNVSSINITLPSALLASSDIWDDAIRNGLAKPRFKKKELDDRRSKNDIPGTPLSARRQDDRIPVLLIQRSLEAPSSSDSQALHGWTLIVPAGWSMAFFNSLIFTNTRVGGQRERQTQAYEAGTMYYPRDYPFTRAYDAYALDRESADKSAWERKPPAKRVNFEALGTRSPWRADWEVVLGLSTQDEEHVGPDPSALVTTQREIVSEVKPQIKPWLLRGPEVPKIIPSIFSVFSHAAVILSEINRLRLKRGQTLLSNDVKSADLLKGALINVKVSMCSRGAPQDLAAIYSLSDDVYRKWEKALLLRESGGISLEDDTPQEAELSEIMPSPNSIIGYVTTGHFSLARGVGFAIGAISVVQLIELEQQSLRLHRNQKFHNKMLASLRNPDSQHCRAVYVEVISDP
ncbi:POP1-domain-containing protein [Phlegmacium glaucopus]|nr:POP1-domain-containing protein [Phlegmacium glaucopus]